MKLYPAAGWLSCTCKAHYVLGIFCLLNRLTRPVKRREVLVEWRHLAFKPFVETFVHIFIILFEAVCCYNALTSVLFHPLLTAVAFFNLLAISLQFYISSLLRLSSERPVVVHILGGTVSAAAWDLPLVLQALSKSPFKPVTGVSLRDVNEDCFSFSSHSELCALSISPTCLRWNADSSGAKHLCAAKGFLSPSHIN